MTMQGKREPIGCASVLIGLNALLMGPLFLGFSEGPYPSFKQELWYGYGSLGFLLAGAVLPALALFLGVGRSATAMTILVGWMVAMLGACLVYVVVSGGV